VGRPLSGEGTVSGERGSNMRGAIVARGLSRQAHRFAAPIWGSLPCFYVVLRLGGLAPFARDGDGDGCLAALLAVPPPGRGAASRGGKRRRACPRLAVLYELAVPLPQLHRLAHLRGGELALRGEQRSVRLARRSHQGPVGLERLGKQARLAFDGFVQHRR